MSKFTNELMNAQSEKDVSIVANEFAHNGTPESLEDLEILNDTLRGIYLNAEELDERMEKRIAGMVLKAAQRFTEHGGLQWLDEDELNKLYSMCFLTPLFYTGGAPKGEDQAREWTEEAITSGKSRFADVPDDAIV